MPGYAALEGTIGTGPVNDLFTPDTTQRFAAGQIITGVDPVFGYGEFMYCKAAGTQPVGTVVYISDGVPTATALPSAASQSFALLVARQSMTVGQWGWYQRSGICPVACSASVAAGAAPGVGTAGKLAGYSTLKGVVGLTVLQPSTYAITKSCPTVNGATKLSVPNIDGLFLGLAVSGTGIAGGSTISTIDPSGNSITLNNAMNASGQNTVTFTYTGFLLCHLQNPACSSAVA
jgi:hypothetical protein